MAMRKVRGLGLSKSYPGKLFVVEGCEGSGKSTQVNLLKKWLEEKGYGVFTTAWNSSDLIQNSIKEAQLNNSLTPTTFSLIHATDFADRYEKLIWPHLRAGYIVLSDRYIYTAYARDIVRGCNLEWVRNVYNFAAKPSAVFYLQAPVEVAVSRILKGKVELNYHEAGMDMKLSGEPIKSFQLFQQMIQKQYEEMIESENFLVVDATKGIQDQQSEIRKVIAQKLRGYKPPSYCPPKMQTINL